MAFTVGNRSISKIGVIGSGQIGPDIALHMTKVMQPHDVPVVVVDVSEAALTAGRAKLEKKIDKGVESGAFKPDRARAMKDNTTFTDDYAQLEGADLIVEAASEDLKIKRLIFGQLEGIVSEDAILASNSSHMEPEVIFGEAQNKARTCVIHYFFPAERNPMVEIVPGAETDGGMIAWLMDFYEEIGKVPIEVGSRYGYAMDPIFEGLFHAAALCVEEGLGTVKEVDSVARKVLKQGVGPFTAMNLTGGNPLTYVGLQHYNEKLYPWFRPTKLMEATMEKNEKWDTAKRGEKVLVSDDASAKIRDRMLGAYFGIVGEILDSGISNVADLEMGVQTALVTKPPFEYMNEVGVGESLALVEAYAKDHRGFPVPECIKAQADKGPWKVPFVIRSDVDGIAVLTIRRPAVLNALNKDVFEQLGENVQAAEADDAIEGIVITGFGRKAFVSGADIGMLAAVKSPEDGEATSSHSHSYLNLIENCSKPVVCAYNGLAFGGGNELALACHRRIARTGLRVLAGQPEPNLGIIPGAGGTQRLPRVIGFEKAWSLLRTGGVMSGQDALASGLISEEVDGDLRAAAILTAKGMAQGGFERISREPIDIPAAEVPDVDLGHLSTAVDAIMCKAIIQGLAMGLEEGLKFESKCFGEVCGLDDMRIGMENFMNNGPRSKAKFENK
ncbi:MAG: 3-hydroxyacyl-CoA dehydrogenase/enoyl-CoA hydratase family protein [Planctomycetota bacterium]|jgi:enoyl-CoA hydratase/3-hydroxyacyl-CoA dehydrogenase